MAKRKVTDAQEATQAPPAKASATRRQPRSESTPIATPTKSEASAGNDNIVEDTQEEYIDYGKLQRNFLTSLTAIKDDDPNKLVKMEALQQFRSLPLRSAKKHELLKSWNKDKSCGWVNQFVEKNEYQELRSETMSDGWGTKYHGCSCDVNTVCISECVSVSLDY